MSLLLTFAFVGMPKGTYELTNIKPGQHEECIEAGCLEYKLAKIMYHICELEGGCDAAWAILELNGCLIENGRAVECVYGIPVSYECECGDLDPGEPCDWCDMIGWC